MQLTALWHHVYKVDRLREAYYSLKRKASPGVDGTSWQDYGKDRERNLRKLSSCLRAGAYQAKPVNRVYVEKPDGKQRPIGILVLEDKIVQRSMTEVLNAIYESDFLGFSYGFRPGRSTHNALDAVTVGIAKKKVNWVLDTDIRGFFDAIDHDWLIKFIEHRIADRRIVRHIKKWLNAGVIEDGELTWKEEGTPQGGSISPLLANIYLHYAFDLWAHQWRQRYARGEVIIVRYADDIVMGFQYRKDAERFRKHLMKRLAKFKLELHPVKTRLIEFGRFANQNRKSEGKRKAETFTFLGFVHICSQTRRGRFKVLRQTIRKNMQRKLKEVKAELRRRMHDPIPEVGNWLKSVIIGHNRYYGVPGNISALDAFRYHVTKHWYRALRRRSQRTRLTWERMNRLIKRWIPHIRIYHPYPEQRLNVIT
jgi:group II intron reverse transcriptase/maturase